VVAARAVAYIIRAGVAVVAGHKDMHAAGFIAEVVCTWAAVVAVYRLMYAVNPVAGIVGARVAIVTAHQRITGYPLHYPAGVIGIIKIV
jgi:hypothetical protein